MQRSATVLVSLALGVGALRVSLPDPHCHSGVLSLADGTGPQACCAGYCGECTDYTSCASVNGQNSTFACCKSRVMEMECGKGAPANVCLKSCTDAVPPCIMPGGKYVPPDPARRQAADDCNEAVQDYRDGVQRAVEQGEDAVPKTGLAQV